MASLIPNRKAPVPPRLAPKPGHVKVMRAIYSYKAQQDDELTFEEGDVLYILDMTTNPNWWKAKCEERTGLVPSNYVEESTEEIINPLHDAAKRGNLMFLQECLSNKVSPNGLDKAGCTALHWAAHGGHEHCLLELLKLPHLEINVQNKLGDTPLHNAAWKGHSGVVTILLTHGANASLRNQENKTAFDLTRDVQCASSLRSHMENQTGRVRSLSHADDCDYGSSGDSD